MKLIKKTTETIKLEKGFQFFRDGVKLEVREGKCENCFYYKRDSKKTCLNPKLECVAEMDFTSYIFVKVQ